MTCLGTGVPEVEVSVAEPADVWAERETLAAREFEARRYWAHLSDVDRAAIGLVVVGQLVRLLSEPEEWLPSSCTGGKRLDIHISVLLPELDRARLRRMVDVERERTRQAAEALELERRLRG